MSFIYRLAYGLNFEVKFLEKKTIYFQKIIIDS